MSDLPLWVIIGGAAVGCVGLLLAGMYVSESFALAKRRKISALRGYQFSVNRFFEAKTISGFRFLYRLDLLCRCVNPQAFKTAEMDEQSSREWLAETFNAHALESFLLLRSHFFQYRLQLPAVEDRPDWAIAVHIRRVYEEDNETFVEPVHDIDVINGLNEEKFEHSGSAVELVDIKKEVFYKPTIEANYAMLTKEQRNAVLRDERFGEYEEMLAVAALKRRLDFLQNKKQTHEADLFSVETDSAGSRLKITWKFKSGKTAPAGYDLVGFRKTGGFFVDQWSDTENGLQVIHTKNEGELTEPLKEGEANFYTLFLKPWLEDERHLRKSPLRFQTTIATKEETEAIETTLERLQERGSSPGRENLSRALKEIGLYVESDNAIGTMEKTLAEQIRRSNYTDEEKSEKISRLHDVVASIRDKYLQ